MVTIARPLPYDGVLGGARKEKAFDIAQTSYKSGSLYGTGFPLFIGRSDERRQV